MELPENHMDRETLRELVRTYAGRRAIVKKYGFIGWALVYLPHYFRLPPGNFHYTLMNALVDPDVLNALIIGFRGSAKSTIASTALPLYLALELPELHPFIIPIADTGVQAAANMSAIKYELDHNEIIRGDYGAPKTKRAGRRTFDEGQYVKREDGSYDWTLESEEEWQSKNILLNTGVRILARSRGQKVRGLRHRQHRPSDVIVDDPEDLEWVKTQENRNKTENWLRGEVIPAIEESKGKLIVIGNLLHNDCLVARLRAESKTDGGLFKLFELNMFDETGIETPEHVTWPAKYPTQAAIDRQRQRAGAVAWQREYKLKVVAEEDQVIKPEDIHYYNAIPSTFLASWKGHGVDLAISQAASADYTTCVDGDVFYVDPDNLEQQGGSVRIFIRPNPYNRHVTFHEFMQYVRVIPGDRGGAHMFYVEDVGYQKAAIQEMERMLLPVQAMKPTSDKRSRLQVVAQYIKNGTVVFPRTGCDELIGQMLNLGTESHDDLVDALVWLIWGLVDQGLDIPKVRWVEV